MPITGNSLSARLLSRWRKLAMRRMKRKEKPCLAALPELPRAANV